MFQRLPGFHWILLAIAAAFGTGGFQPAIGGMSAEPGADPGPTSAEVSDRESDRVPSMNSSWFEAVQSALSKRYPGARIELQPAIRWVRSGLPAEVSSVAVLEESARGEAKILINGFDAKDAAFSRQVSAEGWIGFSAWMHVLIAKKRILPGERLVVTNFDTQEVNVATGNYREIRGLLLSSEAALGGLESRQTILEGGALLSSSVQRVPDVRRGDVVRVQLISNGVTLSVPGTAEEPGFLKGNLRVLTDKTKRSLVGRLESGNLVEVNL